MLMADFARRNFSLVIESTTYMTAISQNAILRFATKSRSSIDCDFALLSFEQCF